ncbi:MAG: SRPBCC domain-containing protein [Vicinamibacterales bacterium]
MKHFEVRRVIAAPDRVWATLTNAEALVSGGLGITRLDGSIADGAALTVWSEASPGRAFAVRVTEFSPPQRMVWTGGLPLGLFTGVRQFSLTPRGAQTEFYMREEFSGWLAPLIGRTIPDLTPTFERFASGLARLAEGQTR